MATNHARIIWNLPEEPVFEGDDLSDRPYTPFVTNSPYSDAVAEYNRNAINYIEQYNRNRQIAEEEGLRTAEQVPSAIHNTFLHRIKIWFRNRIRRTRRNNRVAPVPILIRPPVHRTYGPSGKKSRKRKRRKRKKTRRKNKKINN